MKRNAILTFDPKKGELSVNINRDTLIIDKFQEGKHVDDGRQLFTMVLTSSGQKMLLKKLVGNIKVQL